MKKYENFCRAYSNLLEGLEKQPPYDTVTLTGIVALFEITFEQALKMMKEILEYHGYADSKMGSPRMVIKTAYQANMIDDEEVWLKALIARNNVAHSYNEKIALGIVDECRRYYADVFAGLKNEITSNWI